MEGRDNEDVNEPQQPRQPRNMQGLLRFAMDATRGEDAPNESNYQEMDEERRKFLEEALKSLTLDVVEELEKAVKTIIDSPDSCEEELLDSFEIITNYIQDIDSANDFYKVGGFCVLKKGLSSSNSSVKNATTNLIADLAQNNPFCQQKLLEMNVLNQLMELLSDINVSSSAMRAISCMVRSYEPCIEAFVEIGGLECILFCISDDSQTKLQTKIAFLISNLIWEHPKIAEELIKLNAIDRIVSALEPVKKEELDDENVMAKLENFLRALNAFCDIEVAREKCRTPDLNLKPKLERIIKSVEGRDEFLETVEYSTEIINKCFEPTSANDADR